MTAWIFANGSAVVAILELLGFVVLGFFAFTGIFSSKIGDRRNESDSLADGLIKRLQLTVDQNGKDMGLMNKRIDDQQREIHQLQGKNEAYLQIITLRDPNVAKVFEDAPAIFELARQTNQYTRANNDAIEKLTKAIEEFINRLPPFMPTMAP